MDGACGCSFVPFFSHLFFTRLSWDFAGGFSPCVCALWVCSSRTRSAVVCAPTLFASPRSSSCAVSKNAVSFFLREVISGTGAVRGDEGPPLRAHSIRGVSTSAVFLQNWSVSKVLEATTWKSNSAIASFYFHDIQYVIEGLQFLFICLLLRVPLLILHNS